MGDPGGLEALRRAFPRRPRDGGVNDRAILTGAIAHVTDVEDPEYKFGELAQATGYRSILAVPMLRDGQPVGAITVTGMAPKAFSPRQVDLLKTFADQAVIAIERTFASSRRLEARTGELTRSVGELRALGEVSRAVGSTLDIQTVLATIVSRAVPLSGAQGGVIYEYDEVTETFHLRASHHMETEPWRCSAPSPSSSERVLLGKRPPPGHQSRLRTFWTGRHTGSRASGGSWPASEYDPCSACLSSWNGESWGP